MVDDSSLYNIEAEEMVLAGVLRNHRELPTLVTFVKTNDFFNVNHQAIYKAMLALDERNEPIDLLTLVNELNHLDLLEKIGGDETVYNLLNNTLPVERLEIYARMVVDAASRRRLVWAGEQIIQLAKGKASLDKIRERGENWLVQATPSVSRTIDHIAAAVDESELYFDQMDAGTGDFFLPAMLHDVERTFGSYVRGEATILANFTGNGKTAWALQEAVDKARRGYGVLYISIEVYRKVLVERLISHLMQINYTQVQYGWKQRHLDEEMPYACPDLETFRRLRKEGQDQLRELPIHFMARSRDPRTGYVTSPTFTPSGIRTEIRNYAEKHKIDFIILDYITKMDMPGGRGSSDRSLIVELGMNAVREGLNDVGAAGLFLAQYNREASKSDEPGMHQLEQSTGIEKGADNVWLGYSPDPEQKHVQQLIGAKGRNRGTDVVEGIQFNGYTQTFTDAYGRRMAQADRFANYPTESVAPPLDNGYQTTEDDEYDIDF